MYFCCLLPSSSWIKIIIKRKAHGWTSSKFSTFLCSLPVVLHCSFSGGVAIPCVLPGLCMTSCFYTMGPVGQSQARRYVSKNVRQVVIPVGRQAATVFSRVHQNVAPGGGKVCYHLLYKLLLIKFTTNLRCKTYKVGPKITWRETVEKDCWIL